MHIQADYVSAFDGAPDDLIQAFCETIFTPLGPVAGVISGGLDLVSGALNEHHADDQANFQERMSNTAYQRSVADMKAAGINPILAAKVGGASTPSGSQMDTTMPDAVHSAVSAYQQGQQIDLARKTQESVANLNTASASKAASEANLADVTANRTQTQDIIDQQQAADQHELTQAQIASMPVHVAGEAASARHTQGENELIDARNQYLKDHPWVATARHFLDAIGITAGGALSNFGSAIGGAKLGSMLSKPDTSAKTSRDVTTKDVENWKNGYNAARRNSSN